ncbi:MAG: sigma-54-dependent Fis family transcriptional regulator [Geobacter sp.]|nr:sigma-54-dependent Fis family transcriptional regulator [Geobacter sp.]
MHEDHLTARILICDDEAEILRYLRKILTARGLAVETFTSGATLLKRLENRDGQKADLVLLDVQMPDLDGIEVLQRVKGLGLEVPVVIMTAYGSINSAVETIKLGAYDYVTKPFPKEKILGVLEKVLEREQLLKENLALKEELAKPAAADNIVYASQRFREVYEMARHVAQSDANVLVLGESGTGKELIAGLIHNSSLRKGRRLLSINCAALTDTLLESQLFGHVRGAFTGAVTQQKGLLEEANGGTIFLDEVGDMSPAIQAKLLRVIQERDFMPVGGTVEKKIDIRLVAATNKDLEAEVKLGKFREDLFYRLNVITITLPPLRERKEDVEPLALHFLKKHSQRMKKEIAGFTPDAMRKLTAYNWPGNIRELENVIERATILTRDRMVGAEALPVWKSDQPEEENSDGRLVTLETVEREHIRNVLRKTGFHKSRTAQILGVARRTLDRKIEEYGLENNGGRLPEVR